MLQFVLQLMALLVSQSTIVQISPSEYLTPDSEFQSVDPPDWVLDGAVKVFLSLDDLQGIQDTAAIGATVIHAGGPSPYYPLRKENPLPEYRNQNAQN